jgi:ABC-type branched-subunit amino acid transport system substrate-binding protein
VAGPGRFLGRAGQGPGRQAGRGVRLLPGQPRRRLLAPVRAGRAHRHAALLGVQHQRAQPAQAAGGQDRGGAGIDLDPENKRFVTAFRARHKAYPSHFAAQGYDTINLIAAAAKGAGGKAGDTAALRTAMRRAEFESVRGKLVFGKNQFPVQTYYRVKVVADPEGTWILANDGVVVESMADPYAAECEMKE